MNLWLPVIVVVWSCCVLSGRKGSFTCLILPALPTLTTAEKKRRNKLSKGKLPDVDQFPWMGIIEFQRDLKGNIRNAVLISGRYALSVAQCFTSDFVTLYGSPTNLRFREYGRDCEKDHGNDCKEAVFKIPILKVLVHHQYNASNQLNDIALLRLLVTTPYTDVIRPICLPTQDFTIGDQKDLKLVTSGWKSPVPGMAKHNPIMRYFDVPHYFEAAVCAAVSTNVTKEKRTLGDRQLCATIKNREDCSIDIGGPLILYNKVDSYAEIAGIASFTMCKGMPDVYTKVFEYRSWILDNID